MCPPCRGFVKKLVDTYAAIKSRSDSQKFEIIFCSCDRSLESFNQFFATMPWYAIPFGDPRLSRIARTFCIREIPCLLILDENNQIITRHGRCEALCDQLGKEFPWYPRSVIELNQNTCYRLRQDVCLILFTEGTSEDLSFAQNALLPIAEDHFVDGYEPDLVFFYAGESPVCERALDTLGLSDVPLPLICIIDPFSASLFICEHPNVSEEIIRNFISRFERDELMPVPLQNVICADVKS
ncbi:unnamed protein product [Soboliphyme baturini]|uniref:Thioredoxin-like_fold domain-containing protein n=1 Tax=Soboliphyme baturini TaxID=241478 RepID=A0A183ITU8_9BILA|nr:unnamed protein product [Soboliphyme baturini]